MRVPFMKPLSPVAFVLLAVLAAACSSDPTSPVDPADLEYAPELGVDLSQMTLTASGLYFLDELIGNGEQARLGDQVTVHYDGWLHDGRKFDSSLDRGQAFTVPMLGAGWVIAGWDEGLPGMREGGRRLLVIPPDLAYGSEPVLDEPWATLVFRVYMVQVVR